MWVGVRLSAMHGMVVFVENLVLLLCVCVHTFFFLVRKEGTEPFLLSDLPCLEGMQLNKERDENNSWLFMWKVSAHTCEPPNTNSHLSSWTEFICSFFTLRWDLTETDLKMGECWVTLTDSGGHDLVIDYLYSMLWQEARKASKQKGTGRKRECVISSTGSGPALREDANINQVCPPLISRKMQMPFLWALNLN